MLGTPHQTIITIHAETMELLPTGKVNPVTKQTKKLILSLSGNSKEACEDKLSRILDKVKELNGEL